MTVLYIFLFTIFIVCILLHSEISLFYALMGLNLWYNKMIPALLPFMIISGILIRMNLTEKFTAIIYPVLKPVLNISRNVCYCIFIGFLCGFPMGARTVADMYGFNKITKREAEYLLAFVNNIGPVYFTGFVLPLLSRKMILPYIFGMYGIPFLYGAALRYSIYRDIKLFSAKASATDTGKLLKEIDNSINAGVTNILALGGYMILFNLLNLIPHIFLGKPPEILAPLFEISGGLSILGDAHPLYALLALPFGGLSCIAQTYNCIKNTDLSISQYTIHKFILTGITALYYLLWYLLFPESFLR